MTARTTVCLPRGLLSRAKKKAAAEGRTLSVLIEEGLRLVLSGDRAAKAKPILPRISKATGGPAPGIDFTSFSALEELDDLDYVRRMQHLK